MFKAPPTAGLQSLAATLEPVFKAPLPARVRDLAASIDAASKAPLPARVRDLAVLIDAEIKAPPITVGPTGQRIAAQLDAASKAVIPTDLPGFITDLYVGIEAAHPIVPRNITSRVGTGSGITPDWDDYGVADMLTRAGLPRAANEIREAELDILRRPQPDTTGAIHHATAALEAVARSIARRPKPALGDLILHLGLPSPLDKSVEKLWGYASEYSRHGREGLEVKNVEAELVVSIIKAIIVFLVKKN